MEKRGEQSLINRDIMMGESAAMGPWAAKGFEKGGIKNRKRGETAARDAGFPRNPGGWGKNWRKEETSA